LWGAPIKAPDFALDFVPGTRDSPGVRKTIQQRAAIAFRCEPRVHDENDASIC
jgi:hypothetical protein